MGGGGKRVKNDLKLPISVCYALYLRNIDHIIEILIMISTSVFFKSNIINIKIILFFWPISIIFLIIICFPSLSINAKKNSEVCPTFFTYVWLLLFCVYQFVYVSVSLCVWGSVCNPFQVFKNSLLWGYQWPLSQKMIKTQWLTSGDWGCPLTMTQN